MPKTNNSPSHNGYAHHETRAAPSDSIAAADKKPSHSRLSVSIDVITAAKVRDLAFKERTSDSAVVEAALRGFFDNSGALNLHATLDRLGIAPRRRRS